jgi:hypothetical protein
MVRHLVKITVPGNDDYDELKMNVEVYSRGNHYPFNNAPVFDAALRKVANQYDEEDEYRQYLAANAQMSGGGTQDLRMDEMVVGDVKEEE